MYTIVVVNKEIGSSNRRWAVLADCWMCWQSDVKRKASVDRFLLTDENDLKTSKMWLAMSYRYTHSPPNYK